MTIFTLCSNNYLAQAFALGNSLKTTNPDSKFIIGLIDQYSQVDLYRGFEILEVKNVISQTLLFELENRYDVVELNTALKPYYFEYLMVECKEEHVIYLDPDILVFGSFHKLNKLMDSNHIILTPHFTTPQPDEVSPNDASMLRTGVYNLGFCAMSKSNETIAFLRWWQHKLRTFCYANLSIGLFTDQIWMVYAPCFVEKTHILRNLGYNVANWNLHERKISKVNDHFIVNDQIPLIFFHYSNYNVNNPNIYASYNDRFRKENRPDVWPLFDLYVHTLNELKHNDFKKIKPFYGKPVKPNTKFRKLFRKAVNFSLKYIG
jgi:hypothetical protein